MLKTKKMLINGAFVLTVAGAILFNPTYVKAELGDTVLIQGVENEDVKTLQQYLIDLGYLELEETTTYFGEKTYAALVEFQKSQGLEADGSFGPETYKALLNIVSKYEPLEYTRPLKEGTKGEDVKALQERLKVLGFLVIEECTDYYGSMTKEAIVKFQREYGLKVDGIAGPDTIKNINLALQDKVDTSLLKSSRSSSFVNSIGDSIAKTAMKYLGCSYTFGGNGPNSFDCSGFTKYIYEKFGIELPRTSSEQANVGTKISKDELQVGDLLIFSNTYKSGPSHTGIYLGNNKFIHASTYDKGVIISDLNSGYYSSHFSYGIRLY